MTPRKTADTKLMDWSNLQFKARDLIMFLGYFGIGLVFIISINSSLERQGEKLTTLQEQVGELKDDSKGLSKESTLLLQSLQTQINITNTQLRLLEQRVNMLHSAENF